MLSMFLFEKIEICLRKFLFDSDSVCLNWLRQFKKSSLLNVNKMHLVKGADLNWEGDLGVLCEALKPVQPPIKDLIGIRVF